MSNLKHIAIAAAAALSVAGFGGTAEARNFGGGHGMGMHGGMMPHAMGHSPRMGGHMAYRGGYGRGGYSGYGHHRHFRSGFYPYYAFAAWPYYDDYYDGDYGYADDYDCYWRHGRRYCSAY